MNSLISINYTVNGIYESSNAYIPYNYLLNSNLYFLTDLLLGDFWPRIYFIVLILSLYFLKKIKSYVSTIIKVLSTL